MSLCIMYCTVAAAKTGNVLTQITPTQRKNKKKKKKKNYSTQPNSQSTISVARKILQNFERAPIYIAFLLCRQAWAAAIPGKKFEFLDFNSKQKMSLSVFSFELMPTSTQNVYIGTRLTKNAKITNKKFNFWKLPIHFGVAAAHI